MSLEYVSIPGARRSSNWPLFELSWAPRPSPPARQDPADVVVVVVVVVVVFWISPLKNLRNLRADGRCAPFGIFLNHNGV